MAMGQQQDHRGEFLWLESWDRVPDHSWLSKTRTCLPHEAFKLCAEIVERSFAHNLDRGGMRRTWLRARERAQAVHASRHRPQSLIAEAPTHRRRHAAGGRSLRIWLYLRAQDAHWRRSGRSDSPHRLGGWRNRLRRVMLRREVKPSHQQLFNGVIGWGRLGTDIAILVSTGSLS